MPPAHRYYFAVRVSPFYTYLAAYTKEIYANFLSPALSMHKHMNIRCTSQIYYFVKSPSVFNNLTFIQKRFDVFTQLAVLIQASSAPVSRVRHAKNTFRVKCTLCI